MMCFGVAFSKEIQGFPYFWFYVYIKQINFTYCGLKKKKHCQEGGSEIVYLRTSLMTTFICPVLKDRMYFNHK